MYVVGIVFGVVFSLFSSYIGALGVMYLLNMAFIGKTFDPAAFLICPIAFDCVEYARSLRLWVFVIAVVLFVAEAIAFYFLNKRKNKA